MAQAKATFSQARDRRCLKIYAELLGAGDFAIRWMSLDRLRQLTDQDFEYYASAKPEDRKAPTQRWMDWIEREGAKARIDWRDREE